MNEKAWRSRSDLGLPSGLPAATRIRLAPDSLVSGGSAERMLEAGEAMMLAGGRLAFSACNILIERDGRIVEATAPLPAIREWADALPAPLSDRVREGLARLSAPRDGLPELRRGRPLIMGIVNATPDSFSDGGEHFSPGQAIEHGLRLAGEGADIIDIGGESVRPGAPPVPLDEELRRVIPVVEGLAAKGGASPILSLDSRHAGTMEAALAAGAAMINDVTALSGDPRSLEVAAGGHGAFALMHMPGEPATMNDDPRYRNVAVEAFDYLEARIEACEAAGIDRRRLIVDPGIGFGKRKVHNREILQSLTLFHGLGCPILLGASRKGITPEDGERPPRERLPGSLAAAFLALDRGVQILRVHDVAETRQVVELWDALRPPIGP